MIRTNNDPLFEYVGDDEDWAKLNLPKEKKYIMLIGDMSTGYTAKGPYDSMEEAWDDNVDAGGFSYVMALEPPNKRDGIEFPDGEFPNGNRYKGE